MPGCPRSFFSFSPPSNGSLPHNRIYPSGLMALIWEVCWPGHMAQIWYLRETGKNVEKRSAGLQQYLVKSISSRKWSFSSLSNADWQSHGLDSRLQELWENLAGQLSHRLHQCGKLARDKAWSYRNSSCRSRCGQCEQRLIHASCHWNGQWLETWLSHCHMRSCYRQLRHWELGNHGSWQGLSHG